MSTQKETVNDAPGKADQKELRIEEGDSSMSMSRQGIDVMSLELAPDLDSGGDPYNRTGSYCVIEIEE